MHNNNFILHLTLIETIGPAIIQRIIDLQRSGVQTSDLYLFSAFDWQRAAGFSEITAQKLADGLADTRLLHEELDLIEAHDINWVTIEDATYPALLKEIYLPPMVLYWQGAPLHDIKKSLSIVGARKADTYGYQVVNTLVPDFVAAGYTIVSGGAQGIDTMAHEATLKSGGCTIAVLGSGLLQPYPATNKKLFISMIQNGSTVVSSFSLRMQPLQGNFPARNRIVAGLSQGCLVVQAAKKSGALISAHYAMEQGREVFAVPGPINDELSVGCNSLIQNGAKLVMDSNDVLQEFGDRLMLGDKKAMQEKAMQLSLESFQPAQSARLSPSSVSSYGVKDKYADCSDTQKKIITVCAQPSYFDTIVTTTQLSSDIIQSELFNLQLDGIISQDFTGMWVVSKN